MIFSVISGVQVIPQTRIPDERGTVMHILKNTDPHFGAFGEVYASTIYKDVIKGWHKHELMTLNYACVHGRVKLVIHDDRPDSPSYGWFQEIFLGPDSYSLVVIPPGLWNGFKGMDPLSIVINCATHPHDPWKTTRLLPHQALPNGDTYDWGVRCR